MSPPPNDGMMACRLQDRYSLKHSDCLPGTSRMVIVTLRSALGVLFRMPSGGVHGQMEDLHVGIRALPSAIWRRKSLVQTSWQKMPRWFSLCSSLA